MSQHDTPAIDSLIAREQAAPAQPVQVVPEDFVRIPKPVFDKAASALQQYSQAPVDYHRSVLRMRDALRELTASPTPPAQQKGETAAADDFTDAFDALIKEMGPANALVVITGAFVSLTLAVVKNAGHSIGGDLKIDGGKQRDITIHAPKPAQQGEPT